MAWQERVFVWLGGAVFVAALGMCAVAYLVFWSAGPERWSAGAAAVDAALFAVFALHHTVFARDAVKSAVSRVFPDRLLRSLYVWTASVLLLLVLALWVPVGGELYHVSGMAALPFIIVQLVGVWLIGQSVAAIDPLELAGIRAAAQREPLQVSGPYRLVRHPLYLGWVMAVWCTPHPTGDRLCFAIVTAAYLVVGVVWEERSLADTFGSAYDDYKRQVRWRIVPGVY